MLDLAGIGSGHRVLDVGLGIPRSREQAADAQQALACRHRPRHQSSQAGGWIDPTDEPESWKCLLAKPTGGVMRALCLILALVALAPQARAQPLPPDQACSEIVKTLDRITGHRDSNQEAVRRGFIACRLFPTRNSPPPPSGNVMDEIEPNPRGITRSEVEQAVAEWCQTHTDAPLCKKLERP
jgi:hypothetical protein